MKQGAVEKIWQGLPEPLRWILLLPMLWLCERFLSYVLLYSLPEWGISEVAVAFVVAGFFFPIAFFLAPRGKRVVGWILYGLTLLGSLVPLLGGVLVLLGYVTDPGKTWVDYGFSAAWLVAGTISFRICLSEHPKGASPLADIPPEVAACVAALREEAIRLAQAAPMLPDSVLSAVESQVRDTPRTVHTVRNDKIPPRSVILLILSNVCGDLLASGRLHIYRGILSGPGTEVLKAFRYAVQELQNAGYHTPEEAKNDREWVAQQIAKAG